MSPGDSLKSQLLIRNPELFPLSEHAIRHSLIFLVRIDRFWFLFFFLGWYLTFGRKKKYHKLTHLVNLLGKNRWHSFKKIPIKMAFEIALFCFERFLLRKNKIKCSTNNRFDIVTSKWRSIDFMICFEFDLTNKKRLPRSNRNQNLFQQNFLASRTEKKNRVWSFQSRVYRLVSVSFALYHVRTAKLENGFWPYIHCRSVSGGFYRSSWNIGF